MQSRRIIDRDGPVYGPLHLPFPISTQSQDCHQHGQEVVLFLLGGGQAFPAFEEPLQGGTLLIVSGLGVLVLMEPSDRQCHQLHVLIDGLKRISSEVVIGKWT